MGTQMGTKMGADFGPILVPILGPILVPKLVPILVPFWVPFLVPFWVPLWVPFLVPVLVPFFVPILVPILGRPAGVDPRASDLGSQPPTSAIWHAKRSDPLIRGPAQNIKGTPYVSRFPSQSIAYAPGLAIISHRF